MFAAEIVGYCDSRYQYVLKPRVQRAVAEDVNGSEPTSTDVKQNKQPAASTGPTLQS